MGDGVGLVVGVESQLSGTVDALAGSVDQTVGVLGDVVSLSGDDGGLLLFAEGGDSDALRGVGFVREPVGDVLGSDLVAPDLGDGVGSGFGPSEPRPWVQSGLVRGGGESAAGDEVGLVGALPLIVPTAVAAGAALAWKPLALVGVLQRRWRQLVRWVVLSPLVGLFSRIEEDALCRHPSRALMMQFVESNPGSSMQQVQDASGLAWGTVVYHLSRLERGGHLVSERDGRLRRFWIRGSEVAARRRGASLLLEETPRRLVDAIQLQPGLAQNELCDRVGVKHPVASKYLKRLREQGLVRVVPHSRSRLYYPTAVLVDMVAVVEGAPQGVAVAG